MEEVKDDSVLVESNGEVSEIPADTVVMATGFAENNGLYTALEQSGKEVYIVGDARKSPGNIMHSVADGNKVGREI